MKKFYASALGLASLFFSTPMFAEVAQETAKPKQQNYLQTIIMLGAAVIFFYFILLRPEQKRRKKLEKQRSSMQVGAKVTAMGIIGTVDKIEEKTVILEMIDGSKIEVIKQAVTDVVPDESKQADKNIKIPTS